jgi:hypothetical protein
MVNFLCSSFEAHWISRTVRYQITWTMWTIPCMPRAESRTLTALGTMDGGRGSTHIDRISSDRAEMPKDSHSLSRWNR